MYQTINGFLQTWEYEAGATQKVLNALTDESLDQRVTPDGRSLGDIAWHIVTAVRVLVSNCGLEFASPKEDEPTPTSAQVISDSYQQVSTGLVEAIKSTWTDASLREESEMFGRKMSNSEFLIMMIQHQIHHRGQMTILMRQAGVAVPGVYGPSKEEWESMGMEAKK